MFDNQETIAAISTPMGTGAIAVIRLSGKDALRIASKHLACKDRLKPNLTRRTQFSDGKRVVDIVMATYFKAPRSYTGEDMIEISSHGGILIPNEILHILLNSGARLAEPGEFTKRAFLNGKMDLLQAEAVADLIHASSQLMNTISLQILNGGLTEKINIIRDEILELSTVLEHELDFQEEEIDFTPTEKIEGRIDDIQRKIRQLIRSYEWGKYNREGFLAPIVGLPNAGKSSLLNAILARERSIVTSIPGTTRDYIEESVEVGGLPIRLVDTAGLHKTKDLIESLGLRTTEEMIKNAQVVLFVQDTTEGKDPRNSIPDSASCPVIYIHNKIDLTGISPFVEEKAGNFHVYLSALKRQGIRELMETVVKVVTKTYNAVNASLVITRERHLRSLLAAEEALGRARKSLNLPPEILAGEVREALNHMGEITGHITTEDILNRIFSDFCIGK